MNNLTENTDLSDRIGKMVERLAEDMINNEQTVFRLMLLGSVLGGMVQCFLAGVVVSFLLEALGIW